MYLKLSYADRALIVGALTELSKRITDSAEQNRACSLIDRVSAIAKAEMTPAPIFPWDEILSDGDVVLFENEPHQVVGMDGIIGDIRGLKDVQVFLVPTNWSPNDEGELFEEQWGHALKTALLSDLAWPCVSNNDVPSLTNEESKAR